jgi:preprotein translocase subunit SecG
MLLSFFIGLLTVVLVLDCLFLLLLILIQLPKKEAGLGQAFGSSTTDALFGAGSGTALTKMTKYAAVVFFVITFLLAILSAQESKARRGGRLRQAMEEAGKKAASEQAAAPAPAAATSAPVKVTLPEAPLKLTNLPVAATNVPAVTPAPTTNPPTAKAPATNAPTTPQPK